MTRGILSFAETRESLSRLRVRIETSPSPADNQDHRRRPTVPAGRWLPAHLWDALLGGQDRRRLLGVLYQVAYKSARPNYLDNYTGAQMRFNKRDVLLHHLVGNVSCLVQQVVKGTLKVS